MTLKFTPEALKQIDELEQDKGIAKRLKAVRKTLGLMETNLRHPSLRTHESTSLTRVFGWKVFAAYAESKTAAAYRIFWHYGPKEDEITVLTITCHP